MIAEGGRTPEERITYAFRRAVGRAPSAAELRVARQGLERYQRLYSADPAEANRLLHNGEGPIPTGVNPAELAAYAATAGVILNLDETITLE
jgi:hypothetical protein